MTTELVPIQHTVTGDVAMVAADSVPMWQTLGWVAVGPYLPPVVFDPNQDTPVDGGSPVYDLAAHRFRLTKFIGVNPSDVGRTVFGGAGQSNLASQAADGDTRLDPADPRIMQVGSTAAPAAYAGVMSQAVEPLFMASYPANGNQSNMIPFAKTWMQSQPPNRLPVLVPGAFGGAGLLLTSNGMLWDSTVRGNLFDQFVTHMQLGLRLAGPNARYGGVLWLQGETDGGLNVAAADYQAALLALIDNLRAALGVPDLPFLVGQMVPAFLTSAGGTRAAIDAVHREIPRLRANTAFVYGPVGTGYDKGDNLHYNAKGQLFMGPGFAAALPRAVANVMGTPAPVPAAAVLTQSGTTVAIAVPQPAGRYTDLPIQTSPNSTAWTTMTRTSPTVDVLASVTGLTLGSTLYVRSACINEQGTSVWSPVASLKLAPTPNAPTGVTAGTSTSTTQLLTWTPGATDATHDPATSWVVKWRLHSSSGAWTVAGTFSSPFGVVTNLPDTSSIDYQVTAQNAGGTGGTGTVTASTTAPTPLIDDVGVAAARGYGLRKVRAGHTGNAVLVRRSSDSTTQAIGFTGNSLDTASLLTFCGSGSGFIVTWYDQSGNGRDATQATTTAQARIVNAGTLEVVGTRPAANFAWSGSPSCFYADSTGVVLIAAGASSMLAVVKSNTFAAVNTLACEGSTSGPGRETYLFLSNATTATANLVSDAGATLSTINTTWSTTVAQHVTHIDTGTSLILRANGVATQTATSYSRSGATFTATRFILGGLFNGSASPTTLWNGYVCEAVFFAQALSSTQYGAGEANQVNYYGLPA